MVHVLLRHQAGSVIATIVDFSVMIALVSLAGAAPALGTAVGAASGGTVNFLLGRKWIFRATHHHPAPQAGPPLGLRVPSGLRQAWLSPSSSVGSWCQVQPKRNASAPGKSSRMSVIKGKSALDVPAWT